MAVGSNRKIDGREKPRAAMEVDESGGAVMLALELRNSRFAFAVLQGWTVLEFGSRRHQAGAKGSDAALEKLRFLLKLYAPSSVVVREPWRVSQGASQAGVVLRKIRNELRRHDARFETMCRRKIEKFFASQGCSTKHEIASLLALRFPNLEGIVPRKRRPWEPERHITAIFDAIATSVAYDGRPILPETT